MKTRYTIKSKDGTFRVEAEFTPDGYRFLQRLRKDDLRFKGQHIREVLQASRLW